jgi:hypothetical protein
MGYGIYGWQHRMDWEHIRNYPLWIHAVFMTLSAAMYAAVAFLPALAGVASQANKPAAGQRRSNVSVRLERRWPGVPARGR